MLLRLLPEAEEELAAAARWYEDKRDGLGVDFVAMIDRTLGLIHDAPVSFPLWHQDSPIRKCLVQRFPFLVLFVVESDAIVVVAIAHARRRPGYWKDR